MFQGKKEKKTILKLYNFLIFEVAIIVKDAQK
jgi:hypothetical protein